MDLVYELSELELWRKKILKINELGILLNDYFINIVSGKLKKFNDLFKFILLVNVFLIFSVW